MSEDSCICGGGGRIGMEACPQCAGGPWVIRRDGTHVTGEPPAECYNSGSMQDRQDARRLAKDQRHLAKDQRLAAVPLEAIEAARCLMDRYGFRVSVDALHLAHKAAWLRAKETSSERNQELYRMRLESGLSFRELGERYGISAGRADQIFRKEERRAMSQRAMQS